VFRSSRQLLRLGRLRTLALGIPVAGAASVLAFAAAAQAAAPTPLVRSHSPLVVVDNLRGYQLSLLDGSTGSILGKAPEGVQLGISPDPADMAVGKAGNQVFVTNHDSGTVSVVNASTGTVTTVVHVGTFPSSVAIAPSGNQAYISVSAGIAVLDTTTDRLVATIALPSQPIGVAFLPDGQTAYALDAPSNVSVIDTATNSVTATISGGFSFASGIVASHSGTRVYVAVARSLYVIDTASNTIVHKYYLAGFPTQLTLAPDGSRLYITESENPGLNALDLKTGKLIRLAIGSHVDPGHILLSADGSTVYLLEGDEVALYNVATKSVTTTIPLSFGPGTGVLAPDGSVLYVASGSSLARIDLTTDTVTAVTTPVSIGELVYAANGSRIYLLGSGQVVSLDTATEAATPLTVQIAVSVGIALAPNAQTAYVADRSGSAVAVVDLHSDTVTAIIPVGRGLQSILANPDGKYVYVTKRYSKSVTVIDTATNSVSASIGGLGNYPGPMAVSPDGATLYVANVFTPWQFSMINTATDQVTGTGGNEEGPAAALVVNPSGKVLYEIYQNEREVMIGARNAVNLATEWTKTLYGGLAQGSLAISRDSKYVYFAQTYTDKVFVFDLAIRKIVAKIPVGSRPESVALSPDGTRLFVADFDSGTVTVIDTATNTVATTIDVGGFPDGIAVPGQTSSTYPQRG
jgi:YVTN family beta-propeller protein